MKNTKILAIFVLTFGLFLSFAEFTNAEPIGTAFTYQGHLYDANHVANGSYDFQFSLFDSLADGNQVGSDVNKPDVDVTDGYFTVELDFGNVFTDQARWLEIGVRPGEMNDPNTYTILSPRQEITATPHALYALSTTEKPIGEAGEYDGEVNSDMVEDPGANTTINFTSPFTTTAKPQFYVTVVLKQAANGLTEGAAIKAVEDIKGSAGNWTGFDLTVSKYSDGTSIDDTTQVYVTWMAVRR